MKPFTLLSVVLLDVIATLQLVRVVLGWDVVINGFHVPMWVSIVACAVAAFLSVMLWRENRAVRAAV